MGEENEQKIWITTADPQNHWTNVELRASMASIDIPFDFIPITSVEPCIILHEMSGSLRLSNLDEKTIRVKIFNLPGCPLKKKKLNKKTFIKALMANRVPRNQAEGATWFFKRGKGIFSYPNSSDKNWQWLWR